MTIRKNIKNLIIASAGIGMLCSVSACGSTAKADAVQYYHAYIKGHGVKAGWALNDIAIDGGDINIVIDVKSESQRGFLEGLSRIDRTVVARVACPPYSSDFWKFLPGEYGKMKVWVTLYGKNQSQQLSKVTCPFPEKGTIIKYKNTKS